MSHIKRNSLSPLLRRASPKRGGSAKKIRNTNAEEKEKDGEDSSVDEFSSQTPSSSDSQRLIISIVSTTNRLDSNFSQFAVYNIDVKFDGKKWRISRRFNQFVELQQQLKDHFQKSKLPRLPNKNIFRSSTNKHLVRERVDELNHYLQSLAKNPIFSTSMIFEQWLSPEHNPSFIPHYGASSKTYSGWLWKQGHRIKNWKLRWFVIKSRYLFYFRNKQAHQPIGAIPLQNCTIEPSQLKEFCLKLVPDPKYQPFFIKADSKADYDVWHEKLMKASSVYKKGKQTSATDLPTAAGLSLRSSQRSLRRSRLVLDDDDEDFWDPSLIEQPPPEKRERKGQRERVYRQRGNTMFCPDRSFDEHSMSSQQLETHTTHIDRSRFGLSALVLPSMVSPERAKSPPPTTTTTTGTSSSSSSLLAPPKSDVYPTLSKNVQSQGSQQQLLASPRSVSPLSSSDMSLDVSVGGEGNSNRITLSMMSPFDSYLTPLGQRVPAKPELLRDLALSQIKEEKAKLDSGLKNLTSRIDQLLLSIPEEKDREVMKQLSTFIIHIIDMPALSIVSDDTCERTVESLRSQVFKLKEYREFPTMVLFLMAPLSRLVYSYKMSSSAHSMKELENRIASVCIHEHSPTVHKRLSTTTEGDLKKRHRIMSLSAGGAALTEQRVPNMLNAVSRTERSNTVLDLPADREEMFPFLKSSTEGGPSEKPPMSSKTFPPQTSETVPWEKLLSSAHSSVAALTNEGLIEEGATTPDLSGELSPNSLLTSAALLSFAFLSGGIGVPLINPDSEEKQERTPTPQKEKTNSSLRKPETDAPKKADRFGSRFTESSPSLRNDFLIDTQQDKQTLRQSTPLESSKTRNFSTAHLHHRKLTDSLDARKSLLSTSPKIFSPLHNLAVSSSLLSAVEKAVSSSVTESTDTNGVPNSPVIKELNFENGLVCVSKEEVEKQTEKDWKKNLTLCRICDQSFCDITIDDHLEYCSKLIRFGRGNSSVTESWAALQESLGIRVKSLPDEKDETISDWRDSLTQLQEIVDQWSSFFYKLESGAEEASETDFDNEILEIRHILFQNRKRRFPDPSIDPLASLMMRIFSDLGREQTPIEFLGGGAGGELVHGTDRVSIHDFEMVKPISSGGFAKVWLARKIKTRDLYAVKIIRKSDMCRKNMQEHVTNERAIMEVASSNPFMVDFYYAFQTEHHVYLVMEFIQGGDCGSLLENVGYLDEEMARHYIAESVLALQYLHSQNIVHRDLKPDNMLITVDGHIKLTDFGLSYVGAGVVNEDLGTAELERPGSDGKEHRVLGTPDYLSPEALLGLGYGSSVDWWALGIVLFELLVGYAPFNDESPPQIFQNILTHEIAWPLPPDELSPNSKDLIEKLLNPQANQRLGSQGADGVKNHPFFDGLDWENLLETKLMFQPEIDDEYDTGYFNPHSTLSTSLVGNFFQGALTKIGDDDNDQDQEKPPRSPGVLLPGFSFVNFDRLIEITKKEKNEKKTGGTDSESEKDKKFFSDQE